MTLHRLATIIGIVVGLVVLWDIWERRRGKA